ncbi:MAG: helix-turn-helix domain-containing protein [Enterobacteriaceae bacterium]
MANFQIINDLILEKKVAKKDLCESVGISYTALSDIIERNSTKTDTLEKIAKFFRVPVSVFFGEQVAEGIPSADNESGLLREIELLKEIVAEKERTIQILMKQK